MASLKRLLGAILLLGILMPPPVFAAQTWNFTSSVEGWTGRNGTNVRYSPDGGGRLYVDTYGNDPGIVSPSLSLSASANDLVRMYVWTYCPDLNCTVYFMRAGSSTVFTGGAITLSNGASGGTYELSMIGNADWTGTITQVRIDPSGYCGSPSSPGFVAFDWIQTADVTPTPVQVTAPNGGEIWTVGNTQTIQWSNPGGYSSFSIDLSRNGGSTWEPLYSGLPSNYYYQNWVCTGPASTNCRARVTGYYSGGSSSDMSNASFTICQPTLDITYPNGGQTLWMGHDYTVTWTTTSCTDATVKIELYRGPSTMVRQIEAGTPNDGSQVINLPVDGSISAASDYRIAVSAPDGSPWDFSAAYFTISKPTITVSAPVGGSAYIPGNAVPIAWSSQQTLGNVHIEVYKDGASYQVLTTSTPNTGSYSWTVPAGAPSSACYTIGISAMSGHVSDFSDCFTVNGCTPTVNVTYPNGGQTLYLGHDCTVTWNSSACMNENVKIELYKGDDQVFQFEAGTANDGAQVVNFPIDGTLVSGGDYRMAVSAVDMSPWDFSDGYFTIDAPTLSLISPTGEEVWERGIDHTITWTSQNVLGGILIQPYLDGVAQTVLATNTENDGTFTWTIPGDYVESGRYKIGISAMGGHVYDFSWFFTIGHPQTCAQETFEHPVGTPFITCTYNSQACYTPGLYHTAVDYSSSSGTTIRATASGTVALVMTLAGDDHGMGNCVILDHELTGGTHMYSLYAHLASIAAGISAGAAVGQGQTIGVMGGSGYSSLTYWAKHLHFEMKEAPVLNNPSGGGPYWGYTPNSADNWGYQNPASFIGIVTVGAVGNCIVASSALAVGATRSNPTTIYALPQSTEYGGIAPVEGERNAVVQFRIRNAGSGAANLTDWGVLVSGGPLPAFRLTSGSPMVLGANEVSPLFDKRLYIQDDRLNGNAATTFAAVVQVYQDGAWGDVGGPGNATSFVVQPRPSLQNGMLVKRPRAEGSSNPADAVVFYCQNGFKWAGTQAGMDGMYPSWVSELYVYPLAVVEGLASPSAPLRDSTVPAMTGRNLLYGSGTDVFIVEPERGSSAPLRSQLFVDERAFLAYGYSQNVLDYEIIPTNPSQLAWLQSAYPLGTPIVTAIGDDTPNVPLQFSLKPGFPNPFNPQATVAFELPRSERLRLVIFDLSGRLVRVLVDDVRAAGSYKVQWNGTNERGQQMPSGVYVCRMEAGSFRETRRMTLVK